MRAQQNFRGIIIGCAFAAVLLVVSGCSSSSVSKDINNTVSHVKAAEKSKAGQSLLHAGGSLLHKGGAALHKAGGISGVIHKSVHALKQVNHKLHIVRKLRCVFHGYRAVQDLRHKHPGWSALQLYGAARTCRR